MQIYSLIPYLIFLELEPYLIAVVALVILIIFWKRR